MPARAYLVRDEPAGTGRHPDAVRPCTLRGLLAALDDARIRSFGGVAQVVIIREGHKSPVIRRSEHGAGVC